MKFGTLQQLLQHLVYTNPAFRLPLLVKVDLADRYYHIPLSPLGIL